MMNSGRWREWRVRPGVRGLSREGRMVRKDQWEETKIKIDGEKSHIIVSPGLGSVHSRLVWLSRRAGSVRASWLKKSICIRLALLCFGFRF